jgi:hypothetical protein
MLGAQRRKKPKNLGHVQSVIRIIIYFWKTAEN